MDLATAQRLTERSTQELLNALSALDIADPLRAVTKLTRAGADADTAAALTTLAALRHQAIAKLGPRAATMLFTRDGLEQATRWPVAQLHAERFQAVGSTTVADLTCGLGIDSMALADAGLIVNAYELDPVTATFAAHNLGPFAGATVAQADGLQADLSGVDAIFADPARRTASGARINDPQQYQPSLSDVWELGRHARAMGIKVGPGIAHRDIPLGATATWTSVDGDVVEAMLWHEPDNPRPGPWHEATIAAGGSSSRLRATTVAGIPDGSPGATPLGIVDKPEHLADIVIEPDGALIRAHLLGALVSGQNARLISPRIAYLSAPTPLAAVDGVQLGHNYRVVDVLPLQIKKLKQYLAQRHVGAITIKKRGVDLVPETVRKQLGLRGDNHATVILTRIAGAHRAIMVEPIGPSSTEAASMDQEVK